MAFVTAIAVSMDGTRHILRFDIGISENGAFWEEFIRSLVARGLKGVKLVISDAHEGLKKAIAAILPGTAWQRCRVHCMRNILCHVNRKQQGMVSAMVRTIFAQDNLEDAKKAVKKCSFAIRRSFSESYGKYWKRLKMIFLRIWYFQKLIIHKFIQPTLLRG